MRPAPTSTSSSTPFVLGQRLVKFDDVARDLGGVEIAHAVAVGAGLGARDHQQGVEDADQAVRFLDDLSPGGAIVAGRAAPSAAPLRRGCAAASAAS